MDKIEKLFRKLPSKERLHLSTAIDLLAENNLTGLDIKKLGGGEFYRLRRGRYRILFKKDGEENVVYEIRLRNDNTYKNL